MSVNWNWKEKKGVMYFKQSQPAGEDLKFKVNIYKANCLGALIYEYKDEKTKKDMYRFMGFWGDLWHLKACLGLKKGYTNLYEDNPFQRVLKVKLNTFYEDNLMIAKYFAKAGIKVELYYRKVK